MSDENVLTAEIQHRAVPARNIRLAACSVTLLLFCFLLGCGGDNDEGHKRNLDLEGLNTGLKREVKNLEKKVKDLEAELVATQTEVDELHKRKVAQLEEEITQLTLNLTSARRESLALRNKEKAGQRQGIGLIVVLSFLLLLVGCLLVFVTFRYRVARERLAILMMEQVSELSHWRVGDE